MTRTIRRPEWPRSLRGLSREELQALDDEKFARLRTNVVARGRKRTGSPAFAKKLGRVVELKRRSEKRVQFSKEMLLAKPRPSPMLDALVRDRSQIWQVDVVRRRRRVKVKAENFSFIDNPTATLETLVRIARAECDAAVGEIDFLDEWVLDVGPFLVLGLMYEKMAPVFTGGKVTGTTMKVLEAVDLRRFLGMRSMKVKGRIDRIYPFPIHRRRSSGTSASANIALEPSTVERTADLIAAHVDYWLSKMTPPTSLTMFGASKIKGFVGEILNNAERHGQENGDGEWITAGFMARQPVMVNGSLAEMHVCHLCFFNPGRSIAETIADAPPEIDRQVNAYIRRHRGAGKHRDTLATVFALQDGISRFKQGDGFPSGGTGMMDIVEFANEVGRTAFTELAAKVALVSGNAYIRFSTPYSRGQIAEEGEPRLQWFNAENDVMSPPDDSHVLTLPRKFPGTLITLRFVLDGSFAEKATQK